MPSHKKQFAAKKGIQYVPIRPGYLSQQIKSKKGGGKVNDEDFDWTNANPEEAFISQYT